MLPALVAVMSLALLTACAGNGDDATSESGGSGTEAMERAANGRAGEDAATSTSDQARPVVVPTTNRKLIKNGTVTLESNDLDRLRSELDGVVATYRGIVQSEDTRTDDEGDIDRVTVVVRVPVDRFDAAIDDITDLGTLIREQTSSEDVTTKVADINVRVANAERSIAQLRELFSRADKLGDVIRLESELSKRQAKLESLQARQRTLARQTRLSTIHITATKSDADPGPDDDSQAGFVDGLESGWSGLVTFVRGSAHVLGLVLPLGALALVVAVPIWVGVRRIRPVSRDRPSE